MDTASIARTHIRTNWTVYPDLSIVHELIGYKQRENLFPQWGKRIGMYHPVLSRVCLLNEQEWKVFDNISDGDTEIVESQALKNLYESGIVTPSNKPVGYSVEANFQRGSMYVKTTEGCNFACPGCATSIDLIPAIKARSLSLETAKLFLNSFVKGCMEKGMNHAEIKWAGGEPLLMNSFKIIEACQPYIKDLQQKYRNVEISQCIITNGVFLTDEKIRFAVEHSIYFAISLWGTEKVQDKMRRPRNKQETFPIIVDNIRKLQEAGGKYNLIYVLAPYNAADYVDFLTAVWDIESPNYIGANWSNKKPIPLSIAFYRAQHPLQAKIIEKQMPVVEEAVRKGFQKILQLMQNGVPVPPLYKIDYLDLFNTIATPCGTGFTYLAVGPEGVVSCHEGLFGMKDNLSRIKAGENIFDVANEVYKDKSKLLGTNIQFPSKKAEILALHGGAGCPRSARFEHNNKSGYAPSTAKLYAAIYEELLALETMRQSKFGAFN